MDMQILLQQFCAHSLHIRGRSSSTIRRYKSVINGYCRFAHISRIDQVAADNIRAFFFHGRMQRNWKPSSFICLRHSLSAFFKWCILQGFLKTNPTEDVEAPNMERRLPSHLTKQEAGRVIEAAYNYPYESKFLRYRNHAIFSTFILAGLRKSELLQLRYTDVDIENLSIFVNQGKGNRDRVVPMSYSLAQSLSRYLEQTKLLTTTPPFFYTSLNPTVGYPNAGLTRLVAEIRKASRIDFTIHKLRHSFATLMLEGGCDIYSLSRMMGHSDITTTTIYLSASVEHLREQIAKHPLDDIGRPNIDRLN